MTIQVITHVDGRRMVVGSRIHRPIRGPMLFFGNYLGRKLKPPPAQTQYWRKPAEFLKKVLKNNDLGCCTISGAFHISGSWLGNADEEIPYTDNDIVRVYSGACGYVEGDPSTDQGGNEQDVLNWIMANGLLVDKSHAITGWTAIDATDFIEVQQAVYLMENAYLGLPLPDEWVAGMNAIKDGDVWDVAGDPNPDNGHAVPIIDYPDASGVWIDTWGFKIKITKAALAKYAVNSNGGEAYTLLGPDSISKATCKSPAGFDATQLASDFQAIGAIG